MRRYLWLSIKPDRGFIDRRKIKKKVLFVIIVCLLLYMIYAILFPQTNIKARNYVLFLIAVLLAGYGFLDILKNGVRINNAFLTCYFIFLALNNLNLSRLQKAKELIDMYYLLIGPIIFFIITRMFDHAKIRRNIMAKQKCPPDLIAVCLIVCALASKIMIYSKTGIRLFDSNWHGGGTGDQYTVGGLTGVYMLSIWLSLLLVPCVSKIIKVIIIVMSLLFEAVFSISRNNAMMILIYLLMVYALSKRKSLLIDKKTIQRIIAVIVCMLVLFTVFGNFRQRMRGWSDPGGTISYYLESNVKNSMVNWIYGYTAINYDVLLQTMATAEHPMTLYSFVGPFVRLAAGNSALAQFQDSVYHVKALNGFNASTMFGPMVYEMGIFYVVQVVLLGIQTGILGYVARLQRSDGHYAYLASFAALAVFGNFFSIVIYYYVSVAAIIMFLLIRPSQKEI